MHRFARQVTATARPFVIRVKHNLLMTYLAVLTELLAGDRRYTVHLIELNLHIVFSERCLLITLTRIYCLCFGSPEELYIAGRRSHQRMLGSMQLWIFRPEACNQSDAITRIYLCGFNSTAATGCPELGARRWVVCDYKIEPTSATAISQSKRDEAIYMIITTAFSLI